MSLLNKRKTLVVACVVAVLIAGGTWGLLTWRSHKGDLQAARRAMIEGHYGRVVSEADIWIAKHQGSGAADPGMAGALLLRADALTELGDPWDALYSYEEIIKEHTAAPEFAIAVRHEVEIGIKGVRGEIVFRKGDSPQAIGEELLVRATERMPGSDIGDRALWELSLFYERDGDRKMAALAYQKYVELYPNGSHLSEARGKVRDLKEGPW